MAAGTGQTTTGVGRTSEKGEKHKYNGPTLGGKISVHGREGQEGLQYGGKGACTGAQWPTPEEVEDG